MELKTKKTSTSTKIEQYVLIEPCYSIRFIPFIFECHQVSVLCVAHKTASRIMVLRDSHQLDIQFSFFRLTMSHTMKGIMVEHFSPNLVSRLQKNRKYLAMLTKKLNKYMKLVEIAMVQVLGLLRMNKTLCGQGSILARENVNWLVWLSNGLFSFRPWGFISNCKIISSP